MVFNGWAAAPIVDASDARHSGSRRGDRAMTG
jgi:hypothetical protein